MQSDIRVLVVIDGLGGGGAETSLAAMAPGLIARGIDLQVAYLSERRDLLSQLTASGIVTHDLSDNSTFENIGALRRLIRQIAPDLVHTTLFKSDIVGRIAAAESRVLSVSSIVNEMYGSAHRAEAMVPTHKLRLAHLADLATAQLTHKFHVLSRSLGETMARRLLVRPSKMTAIPRGRDPHLLGIRSAERRVAIRAKLGLHEQDEAILCVGRLDEQKGHETLIRAAAGLVSQRPGARFLFAGREGNSSESVQRLLDHLELNSHFRLLGHRTDIADLMVASDMLVVPSRREGFGGVLIEAMALRTPIVCSDLPVLREVTTSEDGPTALLFDQGQAQSLAEQVNRLLDDPQMAHDLAECGQQHFLRSFTIDRVADLMAGFYGAST